MYREIALKSFTYSLTRAGMRYTIIFSIASYAYLYMYRSTPSYVAMLLLSILVSISSTLSDRRDLMQLISVLHLIGAKRRILFLATSIFISLRSLPTAIAYSIAMLNNPGAPLTVLSTHTLVILVLSFTVVRGALS